MATETIEDDRDDDEPRPGDEIEVEAEVDEEEMVLDGEDAKKMRAALKAMDHQGREMHEASTINCLADSLQMLSSAYSGEQDAIIEASSAIGREILARVRLLGDLRAEGLALHAKEES